MRNQFHTHSCPRSILTEILCGATNVRFTFHRHCFNSINVCALGTAHAKHFAHENFADPRALFLASFLLCVRLIRMRNTRSPLKCAHVRLRLVLCVHASDHNLMNESSGSLYFFVLLFLMGNLFIYSRSLSTSYMQPFSCFSFRQIFIYAENILFGFDVLLMYTLQFPCLQTNERTNA